MNKNFLGRRQSPHFQRSWFSLNRFHLCHCCLLCTNWTKRTRNREVVNVSQSNFSDFATLKLQYTHPTRRPVFAYQHWVCPATL